MMPLKNEQEIRLFERAVELTESMARALESRDYEHLDRVWDLFGKLDQVPFGYFSVAQEIHLESIAQRQEHSFKNQVDINGTWRLLSLSVGMGSLCSALAGALLYLGSGPGSWIAFGAGLMFLAILPFVVWVPWSAPRCPRCGSSAQGRRNWERLIEGGSLPVYQCQSCAQEFFRYAGLTLLERHEWPELLVARDELKQRKAGHRSLVLGLVAASFTRSSTHLKG
ncbi:MAG: hypothetical protein RRB13_09915 [bacterium]|nr:hypothetical protein [bacterium]